MGAAISLANESSASAALPFLAADVGGTHARVALMRAVPGAAGEAETLAYRQYACAQFRGLAPLLRAFVDDEARLPVRHGVLACAGQVLGDEVLNDNLAWPIQLAPMRSELGLADMAVLNDFEALGYAFDSPQARNGRLLCGPDSHSDGPILVIGPGTGLGAAAYLPGPAGGCVLTTEAGQTDYAPCTLRERDVLARLAPDGGYVAYERIVSGPGLLTVYRTLCALDYQEPRQFTPEAVSAAALTGKDAHAREAVDIFLGSLGSFVGNLAMTYMATGGVYLAGGFLSSMFELLERSDFEARYLHGRSVRALLAQVPVRVAEHGRQGVLGAAAWYVRHGLRGTHSPCHAVPGEAAP